MPPRPVSRLNQTQATGSTKSTTMFFSQEVDEDRLENQKKRNQHYEL